jgi:hypothetical protein
MMFSSQKVLTDIPDVDNIEALLALLGLVLADEVAARLQIKY